MIRVDDLMFLKKHRQLLCSDAAAFFCIKLCLHNWNNMDCLRMCARWGVYKSDWFFKIRLNGLKWAQKAQQAQQAQNMFLYFGYFFEYFEHFEPIC